MGESLDQSSSDEAVTAPTFISSPVRLGIFVGGIALLESTFYAVVPPLVPSFVHDLSLTTGQVGLMVGAYPAGVLCATVPAIALIDWRGARAGAVAGLAVLLAATLAFAWAPNGPALDAARFIHGAGGAIAWAGGLGWLASEAPAGGRGWGIGRLLGAAGVGMVLGPVVGGAASQLGRGIIFTGVAGALVVLVWLAPAAPPSIRQRRRAFNAIFVLLRSRQAVLGMGLLVAVGVASGTIATLMPLLVTSLQG